MIRLTHTCRKAVTEQSEATVGSGSTPDLTNLSLGDTGKGRHSPPYSGKKRPADFDFNARPRGKVSGPGHVDIVGEHPPRPKPADARLFDPKQGAASPYRETPEPTSEWSLEANKSQSQSTQLPHRGPAPPQHNTKPQHQPSPQPQRQPGLLELQRYDPRYPGLLLQPDSRPISQEQLASEVKSIYAGLTMVETKCIHVDRAQAQAVSETDTKLASDHWQALIALHRTLLHEHHDFFLVRSSAESPASLLLTFPPSEGLTTSISLACVAAISF